LRNVVAPGGWSNWHIVLSLSFMKSSNRWRRLFDPHDAHYRTTGAKLHVRAGADFARTYDALAIKESAEL
jgi:hypothetical protein